MIWINVYVSVFLIAVFCLVYLSFLFTETFHDGFFSVVSALEGNQN